MFHFIYVVLQIYLISKDQHASLNAIQISSMMLMEYAKVNLILLKKLACSTGCSSCTSQTAGSCTSCVNGYNLAQNYCC